MKIIIGISLFLFGVIVIAVLTAGLVFYDKASNTNLGNKNIAENNTNGTGVVLNIQEVARHNKSSDCWFIISGKVFNVTTEINLHPGGSDAILAYCGKDATNAFVTKNKNPAKNHSSEAKSLLENYYLGDIDQTISQQDMNQKIQKNSQASPGFSRQDDDDNEKEYEDEDE